MSDIGTEEYINQVRGPEDVCDEPDSAQRVVSETRYVFIAYANEQINKDEGQEETLTNAHHQMSGQNEMKTYEDAVKVGRQLAKVADDMQKKLSATFEDITQSCDDESLTSYENFKAIAQEILKDDVNWGRILVIFCFGYWLFKREIVKQAREKMGTTLSGIASFVAKFFNEAGTGIAAWIALRGGWKAAKYVTMSAIYVTRSKSHTIMKIGITVGVVAVAIGVVVVLVNRGKSTP